MDILCKVLKEGQDTVLMVDKNMKTSEMFEEETISGVMRSPTPVTAPVRQHGATSRRRTAPHAVDRRCRRRLQLRQHPCFL